MIIPEGGSDEVAEVPGPFQQEVRLQVQRQHYGVASVAQLPQQVLHSLHQQAQGLTQT